MLTQHLEALLLFFLLPFCPSSSTCPLPHIPTFTEISHGSLPTAWASALYTVHCALFTFYCSLCTVHCVRCTVHRALCTGYCAVCSDFRPTPPLKSKAMSTEGRKEGSGLEEGVIRSVIRPATFSPSHVPPNYPRLAGSASSQGMGGKPH